MPPGWGERQKEIDDSTHQRLVAQNKTFDPKCDFSRMLR
jgi:hypothetical protein